MQRILSMVDFVVMQAQDLHTSLTLTRGYD